MDINKEIEIIKQRLEAEIEKAVKDWWNDFRQLKPEKLPWFNSGVKGFLRKVYYNNSPENPDWQNYRMEHSKLTLSEYAKIQDDLDLFMIENNPSNLVPKDILDSLKNKIKIIINKELNNMASLFKNYITQSGINPNTNQPLANGDDFDDDDLKMPSDYDKKSAKNQPSKNDNLSLANRDDDDFDFKFDFDDDDLEMPSDHDKKSAKNQPSKNDTLSLADDDDDDFEFDPDADFEMSSDYDKKSAKNQPSKNDTLSLADDEDDDDSKNKNDSKVKFDDDSKNKNDSKVKFDDDDDLTIPKLIPPSLGDENDEDEDEDGDEDGDEDNKIKTTSNNDDSKENENPIKKEDLKSVVDSLGNIYYNKQYGENKEISGEVAKVFKSIGVPANLKKTPSGTLYLIKPSQKSLENVAHKLIALMNELKELKELKPDGDEHGSYDNKDYSFNNFGIPEDFISNLEDSKKSWDLLAKNNDPNFVMGLKISRDLLNKINEINNKFGESALFRFKQLIRN